MRLLPNGPRSVLVEFGTIDEVMAADAAWRAADLPGVIELVPAARTVMIVHDGRFDAAALPHFEVTSSSADGPLVEVPVVYDGTDLAEVAARCDLTIDEVVELHSGAEYTCAFCGFMPGFGYLVGLDARLRLPRRGTPRTRVPGGSVAIAADFTAVYPSDSPGGWHLLGRTELTMWDDRRNVAATLPPGSRVRFVPR